MADPVERYWRPFVRGAVDRLLAEPSPRDRLLVSAGFLLLVLLVAVTLSGLIPPLGAQTMGPLPIPATASPSDQVLGVADHLRLTDKAQEGPIDGLATIDPTTRIWIDKNVCRASLSSAEDRRIRAWRMDQNPELCGFADKTFGSAPLNLAFGPVLGVGLTLLILLALLAPLVLFLVWLPKVRDAYGRLYVSSHRPERLRDQAG